MAAYYSEVFYGPSRKADQTFQVKKHRAVKVSRRFRYLSLPPHRGVSIKRSTILTLSQPDAVY